MITLVDKVTNRFAKTRCPMFFRKTKRTRSYELHRIDYYFYPMLKFVRMNVYSVNAKKRLIVVTTVPTKVLQENFFLITECLQDL